ncbi:MAG TPA: cytidine deaminase [Acidobacteriota bacterium]|nr:cytidine deaminase [Acidobacteriota bacterium]
MIESLIRDATQARQKAFAPFSQFRVGAALLLPSGVTIPGANIESASYGLTICAERVAIFKAVSEGHREFQAIAIVADSAELITPCGACRQIIWEFCGDIAVVVANLSGSSREFKCSELLPFPFGRSLFE